MTTIFPYSVGRLLFAWLAFVLVALGSGASAFAVRSSPTPFPESSWQLLSHEVNESNPAKVTGDTIERWLLRSVDLLIDTSVTWDQLGEFLELLEERQKAVSHTSFQAHRLLAFRSAWSRLRHHADGLGLSEAHALFVHSQNKFPRDWTLRSYEHERFAHFSLLAALFQREREKTPQPLDGNVEEWGYLEGRAYAFLLRGGDLQLREFLETTGGDSPFAELAWVTLREYLLHWAHSEEQRAEVIASLGDLEAVVRAGISRRDKRSSSSPDRNATGLHAFREWMIVADETLVGAQVSVYNWEGHLTSRRTFRYDEFEALGGRAGLFIPGTQPVSELFLINKYGSYAGITLIVNGRGQLLEFPGGSFAFDPHSGYLFLREEAEFPGVFTVLGPTLRLIAASNDPTALRDEAGEKIPLPTSFSTDTR